VPKMPTDRHELSFLLASCSKELFEILSINLDNYMIGESEIRGVCPIHDSDNSSAFIFYLDNNLWFCWTKQCHRDKGSDLIGLVAMKLGLNVAEACSWAQKFLRKLKIDIKIASRLRARDSIKPMKRDYWKEHICQESFPESCLERLQSAASYFKNRSLDPRLCANLGAGYAASGKMSGRIVLPVRNIDSGIVGFTGRLAVNGNVSKWIHLPRNHFHIGLNLYNIHRAVKSIRKTSSVILVEGPFDMVKIEMAGFKPVVAVFGCNVTRAQVELLKHCGVIYVVMGFDPDKTRSKEMRCVINKLQNENFSTTVLRWEGNEDFGDMKISKIRKVLGQASDIPTFEQWRIK